MINRQKRSLLLATFKPQLLRISCYSVVLLTTLIFVSCSDDSVIVDPIIEGTEITSFSFLKVNNSSLDNDVYLDIDSNIILGIKDMDYGRLLR